MTDAPVVTSKVGDVKERHDQNDKDSGSSSGCSWRRRLDVSFTRGVVEPNLRNQGFRLAVGFQGEMQEMTSGYEKHRDWKDLKDYHSGNLHEHGIPWVASVHENGGESEEQKRNYPRRENQHSDGFCRHQRDISKRLCDCKETVNRHCADAGVRAVKEGEANFEKDAGMGEINRVKTELGSKHWGKERQSAAQISHGQGQDEPVCCGVKTRPGDNQINNQSISNHC